MQARAGQLADVMDVNNAGLKMLQNCPCFKMYYEEEGVGFKDTKHAIVTAGHHLLVSETLIFSIWFMLKLPGSKTVKV